MNIARILIADDNALVRDGIRTFLECTTPYKVCGEADNGLSAIEEAKALEPDLVILDLSLPGLNGVEVSSVLKSTLPSTKILAFSLYADELKAISKVAHIDAVLPKSAGLARLTETIRRLLAPPPAVNPTGNPQSRRRP